MILPNTTYEEKILKNARFSGKGRQLLRIIINIMRIREKLISYVKLDHTFYTASLMYTRSMLTCTNRI